MNPNAKLLAQLLAANPTISLAYLDNQNHPQMLTVHHDTAQQTSTLRLPNPLKQLAITIHFGLKLTTLICYPSYRQNPRQCHQCCQDPPIKLGTQIQPKHANWVGTAGSPVKWTRNGQTYWGILTNWHVAAFGDETPGLTIHQPTTLRSAIAHLSDSTPVDPDEINYTDAALCDALIDQSHTISHQILDLNTPDYNPITAHPADTVSKVGRTTGLTHAHCSAVGAAAKVHYGRFTATFADQDVFKNDQHPFSDGGDSGSLILHSTTNRPTSLLFAGGGDLTIGNPIRHVIDALNITYPFP